MTQAWSAQGTSVLETHECKSAALLVLDTTKASEQDCAIDLFLIVIIQILCPIPYVRLVPDILQKSPIKKVIRDLPSKHTHTPFRCLIC